MQSASGGKKVFVWKNFNHGKRSTGRQSNPILFSEMFAEQAFDPPSIFSLAKQDLFDFVRLEALYVQAVEHGLIEHTRKMPTFWVAAALTARIDPNRPLRTFSSIVVDRCWNVIPDEHLFWARRLIQFHRQKNRSLYYIASES